jgi:hypothetical protein
MGVSLGKALGAAVDYVAIPPSIYRGFGFPGAEDLGNMFQFNADFEEYFTGARPLDGSRALNSELQTFDQWLAVNKNRIPVSSYR